MSGEQQNGRVLQSAGEEAHHLERCKVSVVQVIDHNDQRFALGYAFEESRDRIEQAKTRLLGIDPLQTRSFSLNWRGPNNLGHQRCHLLNPWAKRLGQLREIRTFGARPNDLDYRPLGGRAAAFQASPQMTRMPRACARAENSSANLVLPMPGSPETRNIRP
jgi:hypothetical protein